MLTYCKFLNSNPIIPNTALSGKGRQPRLGAAVGGSLEGHLKAIAASVLSAFVGMVQILALTS